MPCLDARSRPAVLVAALLLITALLAAAPAAAQTECPAAAKPYVFLIPDISGSMNRSPACTQAQLDAGECAFLCPTGNCYTPLQGDDPASKCYQMKEALHTALAPLHDLQLGFATYEQDALQVRAKHWLYEAAGNGPAIPGWGAFPAAGAREVFGLQWGCDTGSGDHEVGCYPASPADLVDAWELGRMRRLPKPALGQGPSVAFFVRQGTATYRVRYTPASGSAGDPALQVAVRTERCTNAACSTVTLIGNVTVPFERRAEFLSWDDAFSTYPKRTEPNLAYYSQAAAADGIATPFGCAWDPNDDSSQDPFNGYNLRWTTEPDPLLRGHLFTRGDVLPLDWIASHREEILGRLAPNLRTGAAVPDFGTAVYFEDQPQPGSSFLRLRVPEARPLVCVGPSQQGGAVRSFYPWFRDWSAVAAAEDPEWACRRIYLVLLSDDPAGCSDACTVVGQLSGWGVTTYSIGYGGDGSYGFHQGVECLAERGGTGQPYLAETRQQLADALQAIFAEILAGGPPQP